MARRSNDWNEGLAQDLRAQEFAREFLQAAMDEGVPLQVAPGKAIRAMRVKAFAAKGEMAGLWVMMVALLIAVPASAKTLYVNAATGNDAVTYTQNSEATPWRSLGRAVWGSTNREARNGAEAATAGDLVLVTGDQSTAGTGRRNDVAYLSENSGTASQPIVIRAVGRVQLSLSSSAGPVAGCYLRNYVTWDGFTVNERTAPSVPDTSSVVVWDSTGCEIRNFDIDANGVGHGAADNHPGLRIEAARDVRIFGTRIRNVRTNQGNAHNAACIQTYGAGALVIENNDLSDCGSGVFIKGGGPVIFPDTGVIIRNNRIHHIVGGSAVTLHAGAIGTAAHPIRIEHNLIEASPVPAIRIWGFGEDPLNTPMHVEAVHNTIVGTTSCLFVDGAVPRGDAGHVFEHNICVPTDLPVEWDSPTRQSQAAIRVDRTFSPAKTWATVTSGARYSLGQWRSASGQDANSAQGDPRFVSATDLRLQAGSPAQGFGAYVTGTEVIGIPRAVVVLPPPPVACAGAWGVHATDGRSATCI